MTDWWLDEHAHAGAEHLDPEYVAGYDAKAQFDPGEDIAVLRSLGVGAGSRVVDLAAGTGVFAFAAALELGAHVTAVDVSPVMVEQMRARAEALDGPSVTLVEAGFLSYDYGGPPPDVVFSRNGLHQLPDFWKVVALQRIAAMLRTGALLRLRDLVFDLEPHEVADGIETWMAGAVDDPDRGFTAADLAEHVRTEHSTFSWLFEPMLEHAGFEILERSYTRSAYGAYTCRRR